VILGHLFHSNITAQVNLPVATRKKTAKAVKTMRNKNAMYSSPLERSCLIRLISMVSKEKNIEVSTIQLGHLYCMKLC
jgi:hypothetical protein